MTRNIAGPLVRGVDFWGREGDQRALWELLARGDVLLNAPRRHGKSSLMCSLLDTPRAGWTVVMLDVEYVESPSEFLTELSASLVQTSKVRSLWQKAKRAPSSFVAWVTGGIEGVEIGVENIGQAKLNLRRTLAPESWPHLTEQLFAELGHHDEEVLLIIDEFPWMVANFIDADHDGALHFLKWFRALRQQTRASRVRFLLGGSVNLEPRLEFLGCEALINDLQRHHLSPLSAERATEFVRCVLTNEDVDFAPDVPEVIARVADTGIHFFLQVLISECLTDLRQGGSSRLEAERIVHVYTERVLGPANRNRFSHYHTRLKQHYRHLERSARLILAALAAERSIDRADLAAMLRRNDEDVSVDEVLSLLESDFYIVNELDNIMFSSGFLCDWWMRNVPAPRTR